jgi:hypothetical protein
MISVAKLDSGFSKSSKDGMAPKNPQEAKQKNNIRVPKPYKNSFQNFFW